MFNTKRLLLFVALAVIAYGCWPREPNLLDYQSKELAALETEGWKLTRGKQWVAVAKTEYAIFREQYGFSPYRSATLAMDMSRALSVYHGSADPTDRAEAAKPLQSVYETIKKEAKSSFDPKAVAEKQVRTWALAAEDANREAAIQSQAEMLAAIYGGNAKKYMLPATSFISALKAAPDWGRSDQYLQQAWSDLKKAAKSK